MKTIDEETLSIELLVKRFGKWKLGYAWVDLTFGGAPVTGLALYASKDGKADRYVCFGIKECVEFAAKQGLPPKKFAELMGEALSHGPANEVKRYLPAEQIASPGTLAAMRSRK